MKTCYVSAPYGVKQVQHPSGHMVEVDFDRVYREVIVPAVSDAGLNCIRGDEMDTRGVIFKSIFTSVLGSEVMIADISNNNPNVLYELGARHALRRDTTIIIKSSGGPIPHHMNYNRIFMYDVEADGTVSGAEATRLREMLTSVLRASAERVTNDSPIYEFFPGIHAEMPDELSEERARRNYPRLTKKSGPRRQPQQQITAAQAADEEARASEQAVRGAANVDPHALIEVLKKYRDASNWNELVRYADELPGEVQRAPEVMQLLALALNRRNESGDQDRAIDLMKKFIAETGGDGESYGILGRIYKDRFDQHRQAGESDKAEENLTEAINHYRAGFDKQPTDYYPGVNVVTLLLQRRDDAAKRELADILPRVRRAVKDKIQGSLVGYWELATGAELACVAGDWDEAESLTEKALDTSPAPWMIETTARNLGLIEESLGESPERERVAALACRLREADPCEEGQNA